MSTRLFMMTLGMAMLSSVAWGVVYVDANVSGGANNGTSWGSAYSDLQDALTLGSTYDEIRVAQGTYTPDTGGSDRTARFQPQTGMAIYGGFTNGMASRAHRNWDAYETILSGEIQPNGNQTDNSEHIIYLYTADLVLVDGVTITGSYSTSGRGAIRNRGGTGHVIANCKIVSNHSDSGGGLDSETSSSSFIMVSNCVFLANTAGYGGAAHLRGPAEFVDCTFANNDADHAGGAMYIENGVSVTLHRCIFSGNNNNVGDWGGGGAVYVSSSGSGLAAYDTVFSGNQSGGVLGSGGAVDLNAGAAYPFFVRCTFAGNRSTLASGTGGGAVYVPVLSGGGTAGFTNCVFVGNRSAYRGGALWSGVTTAVQNCTFRENEAAARGGAIFNEGSDGRYVQVNNSVFWDNGIPPPTGRDLRLESSGSDTVSWSLFADIFDAVYVSGVASLVGTNLSADPLFPDDISGMFTSDLQEDAETGQCILTDGSKNWTVNKHVGRFVLVTNSFNGAYYIAANSANALKVWASSATLIGATGEAYDIIDVHLKSKGGRYANLGWVTDNVDSPCIDAGNPADAYDLEPSINGDRINMGAYGNTAQASRAHGIPPLVLIVR